MKELKLKDLVTLLGTSCGIFSIILSFDTRYLPIAGSFIYFAMVFDLLDGLVAKLMKQANELGKHLDSLSDVICFGVAPAVLIYQNYSDSSAYPSFFLAPFCIVFVIGAVLRLTWFNISKFKGYQGVTTPVTTSILLSLFFIDKFYGYFPNTGAIIGGIMLYLMPICLLLLPYLNNSRFFIYEEAVRTRENKKLAVFLVIIMSFGLIASILAFFDGDFTGPYIYVISFTILVMLVFYLGIGIYNYIKLKKSNKIYED